MKIGQLRELLKDLSDDCELRVEMRLPALDTAYTQADEWQGFANIETLLVRGTVVANHYVHVGSEANHMFDPSVAIIEVSFDHHDITVQRKNDTT